VRFHSKGYKKVLVKTDRSEGHGRDIWNCGTNSLLLRHWFLGLKRPGMPYVLRHWSLWKPWAWGQFVCPKSLWAAQSHNQQFWIVPRPLRPSAWVLFCE